MTEPRWLRAAIASSVFVFALAVYLLTLAPTTAFVDSGFLTVAAWSLGNAHPPGFPLYLLAAHLFTLLPFGTVALRVNFASAFFAAGACAFVALATGEAIRSAASVPARGRKSKAPAPRPESPWPSAIAMLMGGLTLASSRTLWSWATIAEVYALNTFLIALLLWVALVWRRTRDSRLLYLLAVVSGLALGVHHLTIAMSLLGIAVLILATEGFAFVRSRAIVIALAMFAIALVAIYAYLPLAASHEAPLNWGDPHSLSRVVDHVTAKQYRGYVSTSDRSSQADDIIRIAGRDLGASGLPLLVALAGAFALLRRDRPLFAALAVISLAACAWMLFYPIVNDEDAYLLPLFVCLAVFAGVAAGSFSRTWIGFAAVLALPLLAMVLQWNARDRSAFVAPRLYAENALRGIEKNGLLITNDQDLYGALLYFQNAEQLRPDVRVVHHSLLISSWYLTTLERRHPELANRVMTELGAVRTPLALIEAGGPAGEDPAVRNDFYARLDELVLALIRTQIDGGGRAYATHDVAFSRDPVAAGLVQRLSMTYEAVPRGFALELVRGRSAEVSPLPLDLRGLADGSIRYEPDDVVVTTIRPAYRDALVFRARYLAEHRRFEDAAREYRDALLLAPGDQSIERELQMLQRR